MSDIFSSDGIVEPIDLTDVRAFLSMSPTDSSEDVLLKLLISQCRSRLEDYLGFFVAEQDCEVGVCGVPVVDLRGPVQTLEAVETEDGTDITDRCELVGHTLHLPDVDGWVRIAYRSGAFVPVAVQTALLIMVRNLFTDRTSDPMTREVFHLVGDYVEVNV
jgi:hypothetical protein